MPIKMHCDIPRPDNLTEEQNKEINERVLYNIGTVPESTCAFESTDRLAAQYFFSQLFWLEQIATMAAEKNEVVENQYIDEIVHRESFVSLANHFGGLLPASPEVRKLLDYINSYDGVEAYCLLNLWGESWLDSVFERIATWGYFDELLESIEADEERHHDGAMADEEIIEQLGGLPDKESLNAMARTLEKMLSDIMACPHFSYPMIYFGGEEESAQVGLDICDAHEEVCDHLGIDHDTKDMRKFCRGQRFLAPKAPIPVEMTGWDRSKMNLWKQPAEMSGYFVGKFKSPNPIKMQIDLMKAVSHALQIYPHLNRVVRNDKIWQVRENMVGMRFSYDEDQVSTVYEKDAWAKNERQITKSLKRKISKIRSRAFEEVIDMHDIVNILPPSRCAVVINWSGSFGHDVRGPLNSIEGVPIQIMIGESWVNDAQYCYEATISITMDHRVGDGKEINLLGEKINEELERILKHWKGF